MLERARQTVKRYPHAELRQTDILEMELGDERFDIISTSFVLRSVADHLEVFFGKAYSLLRRGGRFVILELTRPDDPVVRTLFYPYVKFYLPFMGRLLTGEAPAYDFLSRSVLDFRGRKEVRSLLKSAGFSDVTVRQLSFGAGTLFIAEK
jgi:demethylmenaquinone methyltransferase/2-methoxy-6-polyprenyl-1,4-benzoquinol methylase